MNTGLKKSPHNPGLSFCVAQGKPNEFGKLVELQEAENQIVTHYEVFEKRPSDQHLLLSAVEMHRCKLGRIPGWVAADAGFYSRTNEATVQALGVKYVSIPRAAQTGKAALVQTRAKMADGM